MRNTSDMNDRPPAPLIGPNRPLRDFLALPPHVPSFWKSTLRPIVSNHMKPSHTTPTTQSSS
jgi:hypothetical protein